MLRFTYGIYTLDSKSLKPLEAQYIKNGKEALENESTYEDSLCYIYMGQITGEYGLLKEDYELRENKPLQTSSAFLMLSKLHLVRQKTLPVIFAGIYPLGNKTFLQTTEEGEEQARKILKSRIEDAAELRKSLEVIPRELLIFLIKCELLKIDGTYPVDTKDPPQAYVRDRKDIQRETFNCLFQRFENKIMNRELIERRDEFFSILIDANLCVNASAYWISGLPMKKRVVVDTSTKGSDQNKLNYCVPEEVRNLIRNIFLEKIEKFDFPEELKLKHVAYHRIKETENHFRLSSDEAGNWLEGQFGSTVLSPLNDPISVQILNEMLAQKILSLSRIETVLDGKKWRDVNLGELSSKESFRFLEDKCLQPIFDFLTVKSKSSDITIERGGNAEPLERIIDASNVSCDNAAKGSARYRNIVLCWEYYKAKNMKIKIIADANLRHKIDEKAPFQKALDEGKIYQAPSGRQADEYILRLAHQHPKSKIVSNDNFVDWPQKFSSMGDLRLITEVLAKPDRFIKFKVNGAFIEFPFGK